MTYFALAPFTSLSAGGSVSNPNGTVAFVSVTLNRTGQRVCTFKGTGSGGGGRGELRMRAGGGIIDSGSFDSGGSSTMDAVVGLYATGVWGAGTVIDCTFASDNNISGTLYCTFVPTQAYRQ